MTQPNQSELEQMLIKLCWVTAPSSQADVDRVMAYITANYTPNSEVAERERTLGIDAGLEIGSHATKTVVYTDRGISAGMRYGIARAVAEGRPVEYRSLRKIQL